MKNFSRKDLLSSKEYWIVKIQNDLYNRIEEYKTRTNSKNNKLAELLQVTEGYISQILNGKVDHKISKLVELSLLIGKVPIVSFYNLSDILKADEQGQYSIPDYERPIAKVQFKGKRSIRVSSNSSRIFTVKRMPSVSKFKRSINIG